MKETPNDPRNVGGGNSKNTQKKEKKTKTKKAASSSSKKSNSKRENAAGIDPEPSIYVPIVPTSNTSTGTKELTKTNKHKVKKKKQIMSPAEMKHKKEDKEKKAGVHKMKNITHCGLSDPPAMQFEEDTTPGAIAVGGMDAISLAEASNQSRGHSSNVLEATVVNEVAELEMRRRLEALESFARHQRRRQSQQDQIENNAPSSRHEIAFATPATEDENDIKEENEKKVHCPAFVTKRFLYGLAGIFALLVVTIVVVVTLSMWESPSPTQRNSTEAPIPVQATSPPQDGIPSSQCQVHAACQGLTGTPVTANGKELKKLILQYLKAPTVSPHGTKINCWDVSQVTDMSFAFSYYYPGHSLHDRELDDPIFQTFNEPLDCWDTSNVVSMHHMFFSSYAFNQDIGSWDVSKVTYMGGMFWNALAFNQDLTSWDVSKVTDMSYMFYNANYFNGNVAFWDVSSVTDMKKMFAGADDFNQNIGSWDISSVTDMSNMFDGADSFNQNLCEWSKLIGDFSLVNLEEMFGYSGCEDTTTPDSVSSNWCHVCGDV